MVGRNKTPLVGWHPPEELVEWLEAEAARRGSRGARSQVLNEALADYKAKLERRAKRAASDSTS